MTENNNPMNTAANTEALNDSDRRFLNWYRALNDDQRQAVNTSLEQGTPLPTDVLTSIPPQMLTFEQRVELIEQMSPDAVERMSWLIEVATSEGEKLPPSIIYTAHLQDQLHVSEIMALRIIGDMAEGYMFTRTALFGDGNLQSLVESIAQTIQDTATHFAIELE
jgi:chemotaxis regulatin CheY-phosphate phosphatase CheZ